MEKAMKKKTGFKTRPSVYAISVAPTSRATCRVCKQRVVKGEERVVTCAFVKPGRTHNFVSHVGCVSRELVDSVVR